jgi:fatty-acyl-CoA synthase
VLRHVGAQIARFKIPRDVVFVDSLPRNALGKVQHFRLREMLLSSPPPLAGEDDERSSSGGGR